MKDIEAEPIVQDPRDLIAEYEAYLENKHEQKMQIDEDSDLEASPDQQT